MPEWLGIVLFIAGYFLVMKFVLPRLGVPT
jgi:hypothetical protein